MVPGAPARSFETVTEAQDPAPDGPPPKVRPPEGACASDETTAMERPNQRRFQTLVQIGSKDR